MSSKSNYLSDLSDDELKEEATRLLKVLRTDKRENQILYYKPASEKVKKIHLTEAKWVGVSGGNGSSKTESCLVHFIALATGVFPQEPEINESLKRQFKGPLSVRIVVESHTTTLYPVFLPKLRYFTWTGVDKQGGERGHWGWVPKSCLIDGSWDKSWQDKTKLLTLLCKDPDTGALLGKSTIQFMSKSQDPEDFASGDLDLVLHDEPPLYAQWRENQARTMRVNGRIFLSFTWPDDPTIPVDWIFDELYDKQKQPNHDWIELWTTDNVHLNQDSVSEQAAEWSEDTKRVRLFGGSMRFSNRIHPLFTDSRSDWCFTCHETAFIMDEVCSKCGGDNLVEFNHVQHIEYQRWPCIFMLDPHPRKPHMFLWAEITPSDDIRVIAEGEIDDTPEVLAKYVLDFEEERGFHVPLRMIDPNMGRSPSGVHREITSQDEFDKSGIICELADDSSVGRAKVNEYLKPDKHTQMPRLIISEDCFSTVYQMKRYVWQDFKTSMERDVKQVPRDKYDDYPSLLKYLVNYNPQFSWLHSGAPVIKRQGTRRGAY